MPKNIVITEEEKETLRFAYLYLKVRFIVNCNGTVKLYGENSQLLSEQNCGNLYYIGTKLVENDVVSLSELINKPVE